MINLNDLKNATPSVFATSASPKMSNKYVFVPTLDILENFEREGWQLASAKQVGRGLHSVHDYDYVMVNYQKLETLWLKQSSETHTTVWRHSE